MSTGPKKITELPAATSLANSDLVLSVSNGTSSSANIAVLKTAITNAPAFSINTYGTANLVYTNTAVSWFSFDTSVYSSAHITYELRATSNSAFATGIIRAMKLGGNTQYAVSAGAATAVNGNISFTMNTANTTGNTLNIYMTANTAANATIRYTATLFTV